MAHTGCVADAVWCKSLCRVNMSAIFYPLLTVIYTYFRHLYCIYKILMVTSSRLDFEELRMVAHFMFLSVMFEANPWQLTEKNEGKLK